MINLKVMEISIVGDCKSKENRDFKCCESFCEEDVYIVIIVVKIKVWNDLVEFSCVWIIGW